MGKPACSDSGNLLLEDRESSSKYVMLSVLVPLVFHPQSMQLF